MSEFIAIAAYSQGADIKVLEYDGVNLTLFASSINTGDLSRFIGISPSGQYIAVTYSTSPLRIFRWDGKSITYLAQCGIHHQPQSVLFLDEGHIVVRHSYGTTTGGIFVFGWNGTTLTLLASYNSGPCYGMGISDDGQYIGIGCRISPQLRILRWDGASLSLIQSKALGSYGYGVAFTSDNQYVAVGCWNNFATCIYKWTITLDLVAIYTTASERSAFLNFDPSGIYLITAAPYLTILRWSKSEETLTHKDTYNISTYGSGGSFNSEGNLIASYSLLETTFKLLGWDGSSLSLKGTYTTYNFQAVFMPPMPPAITLPECTTNPATNIQRNSATLNGYLNDDGGEECDCCFHWGLTQSYGDTTPIQGKTTGQSFQQTINNLLPLTKYHFRAKATNVAGDSFGEDETFRTLVDPNAPNAPQAFWM